MSNKIMRSSSINHVTLPDNVIWHFRLGHIFVYRMNTLHIQFPFINVDQKSVCDVCHFEKQRKLSFSNSSSRALLPFDLIYFDI